MGGLSPFLTRYIPELGFPPFKRISTQDKAADSGLVPSSGSLGGGGSTMGSTMGYYLAQSDLQALI